ncbi:MAG: tyrosine-type recombinase/integrase [Saprospiraceae bacterium]
MTTAQFNDTYRKYEDHLYLINASSCTRKAYLSNFRRYFLYCNENNIAEALQQEYVRQYLVYRVKNGAKWQTMNNIYSAMRKLFREVLQIDWSFKKLPRPKKERYLPQILSQQDVQKLIINASNTKHQAIIVTLYSTGMRLNELRMLKISDIDSDRLQIRISKGKGAKDRYIQIPDILITVLRAYFIALKPKDYLFNGRISGTPISARAVQWAIKSVLAKCKILKTASPHTLRHCYATHHLESGTDLVYLQENMGHKHLKTTARYIHLCKERYQHINHPIAHMDIPLCRKTMV